jgi:hypothetical protein
MLVSGVAGDWSTGVWTQPSGWTLEKNHTSGTGKALALADTVQATHSATGSVTWSDNASATLVLGGYVAALRPVPAPVDIEIGTDSGTPILGLVPSGSETYTPSGGAAYSDSDTLALGLVPSVSEFREITDSTTAVVNLIPSVSDISGFVDASTLILALTAGTLEVLASTDSLTANVVLTPSVNEVGAFVDASTIPFAVVPSSSEVLASTDAQTSNVLFTPSGTETYVPLGGVAYSDSATGQVKFTPTYAELSGSTEAAVVNLVLMGSGVDAAASVDSQTSVVVLSPVATEVLGVIDASTVKLTFVGSALESKGQTYLDTTAVGLLFSISATDVREFAEASVSVVALRPLGAEALASVDSLTAIIRTSPSVQEIGRYVDALTVALLFSVSGSDVVLAKHVKAIFRGHGNGARYRRTSSGRLLATAVGSWNVKAATGRFHASNQ